MALALLERLQSELIREASATLTLERWCRRWGIDGDGASVVTVELCGAPPVTAIERERLGVGAGTDIRSRRVHLRFGRVLLSQAENWYLPKRLTAPMNDAIDSGSVPFGKAVADLNFSRSTLSSRLLWSPLDAPAAGATLAIPDDVLRHRAVLSDRDGRMFALLTETYRSGILAVAPPLDQFPRLQSET